MAFKACLLASLPASLPPSVHPACPSTHPSVHLPAHPSIHPSVPPPIHPHILLPPSLPPFLHPYIHPPIQPFIQHLLSGSQVLDNVLGAGVNPALQFYNKIISPNIDLQILSALPSNHTPNVITSHHCHSLYPGPSLPVLIVEPPPRSPCLSPPSTHPSLLSTHKSSPFLFRTLLWFLSLSKEKPKSPQWPLAWPCYLSAECPRHQPGASALAAAGGLRPFRLCLCLGHPSHLLPSFQLAGSYLSFHSAA